MLNVALIDSGVYGTTQYFAETPEVRYRIERIRNHWQPDFSADDLVVVPNGANHVALYEVRGSIRTFLDRGGTLACFCGFFTPWIPGNQWVHDNRQPLKAVRYRARSDPLGLLEGVDIDQLTFESHGISGWWACGEIITDHPDSVLLEDNFGRVIMVADTTSTLGLIIATASGPLGDPDPSAPSQGIAKLYRNIIRAATAPKESSHV